MLSTRAVQRPQVAARGAAAGGYGHGKGQCPVEGGGCPAR